MITGVNGERATEQRESVRAQISFYASTPTYFTVLEAHGWEDVGERLSTMAREKKWREMPAIITDEMLGGVRHRGRPGRDRTRAQRTLRGPHRPRRALPPVRAGRER